MVNNDKIKAVSLFSGGLDSILAVKIIQEQGIYVKGLFFSTPFFEHNKAVYFADKYGIDLEIIRCFQSYKDVLLHPVCGYGKNMNPCIDCHAFMIRLALNYMRENGYNFIISGEVLGERPMSQNKNALNRVLNLSGAKGFVLRPLSAKLMDPTIPEINGWVEREKLEAIKGRSRKRQFELAEKYGIDEIPSPGGGCLLTDPSFSKRLKIIIKLWGDDIEERLVNIIKVGRLLKINDKNIYIVGRSKYENSVISSLYNKNSDILVKPVDIKGPIAIIPKAKLDEVDLRFCAGICLRYSDLGKGREGIVAFFIRGEKEEIKSYPVEDAEIRQLMP